MEIIKGRGINCENEVYFDYVDGEIVMTMYRDMVGVRMDRRDPNVVKSFSIDQWEEINGYLRETLDDAEGVFDDGVVGEIKEEEREEEEVTTIHSERIDSSLPTVAGLPKMSNAEAILPENRVPAMARDEVQERFDPTTGTQNEEEIEENGEEDE